MPDILSEELLISALSYGGDGVGRYDGKVIFVPFTAPGDRIKCALNHQSKRFSRGSIVELTRLSDERVTPTCPYFGLCGGCQWQHIVYSSQLKWKELLFNDMLKRYGAFETGVFYPAVPSDKQYAYRSRVRLKCADLKDKLKAGFVAPGSHDVVEIKFCPIASEGINRAINIFRDSMSPVLKSNSLSFLEISEGWDRKVRVVLTTANREKVEKSKYDRLSEVAADNALSLLIKAGEKGNTILCHGEANLQVYSGDLAPGGLAYGPDGFAQVNLGQNLNLIKSVIALCGEDLAGKKILDLYCGMGNFSIPLSCLGAKVTGIESSYASINMAKLNALANNVLCRFIASNCNKFLKILAKNESFNIIILDPPRKGAAEIVPQIVRSGAEKVVYISCDPMTFCRDASKLVKAGYSHVSSQVFDMFPNTFHLESVNLFSKNVREI